MCLLKRYNQWPNENLHLLSTTYAPSKISFNRHFKYLNFYASIYACKIDICFSTLVLFNSLLFPKNASACSAIKILLQARNFCQLFIMFYLKNMICIFLSNFTIFFKCNFYGYETFQLSCSSTYVKYITNKLPKT